MIPKFIELINSDNRTRFVNVNNISSFKEYNPYETLITFVGGDNAFHDKRTPQEIFNLINGTEAIPTKEVLTFPRKMLVSNGGGNLGFECLVIADLGGIVQMRYLVVPWVEEEKYYSGLEFKPTFFEFASEIPY